MHHAKDLSMSNEWRRTSLVDWDIFKSEAEEKKGNTNPFDGAVGEDVVVADPQEMLFQ